MKKERPSREYWIRMGKLKPADKETMQYVTPFRNMFDQPVLVVGPVIDGSRRQGDPNANDVACVWLPCHNIYCFDVPSLDFCDIAGECSANERNSCGLMYR